MTPTRAHFHEARKMLRVDVDTLGLLAERAVVGALHALLGENAEAAHAAVAGDDQIDALFVALEERTYALLARQALSRQICASCCRRYG